MQFFDDMTEDEWDEAMRGACFIISGLDPDDLEAFHNEEPEQ